MSEVCGGVHDRIACVLPKAMHKTTVKERMHEQGGSDEISVCTCCPKLPHWSVAAAAVAPFAAEMLS